MADAVHWELDGAFLGGGKVDGGFDYNTHTNVFSNISVFTTPDSRPDSRPEGFLLCPFDYGNATATKDNSGVNFNFSIQSFEEMSHNKCHGLSLS